MHVYITEFAIIRWYINTNSVLLLITVVYRAASFVTYIFPSIIQFESNAFTASAESGNVCNAHAKLSEPKAQRYKLAFGISKRAAVSHSNFLELFQFSPGWNCILRIHADTRIERDREQRRSRGNSGKGPLIIVCG